MKYGNLISNVCTFQQQKTMAFGIYTDILPTHFFVNLRRITCNYYTETVFNKT